MLFGIVNVPSELRDLLKRQNELLEQLCILLASHRGILSLDTDETVDEDEVLVTDEQRDYEREILEQQYGTKWVEEQEAFKEIEQSITASQERSGGSFRAPDV